MKAPLFGALVAALGSTSAAGFEHEADYYDIDLADGFRVTMSRSISLDNLHGLVVGDRYASGTGAGTLGITVVVNDFGSKYESRDTVPKELLVQMPQSGRDQCTQAILELDPNAKFDRDIECKVAGAKSYCAEWTAIVDATPVQGYCVGAWSEKLVSYSFVLSGSLESLDHGDGALDRILSWIELRPERGISRREVLRKAANTAQ